MSDTNTEHEVDYQLMMAQQDFRADYCDIDAAFKPVVDLCRKYTMTSLERMYDLYKATQYIIRANIPGAFVECGVWRGGSAMVMARTLQLMGVSDRNIILFDTFEGHIVEPDKNLDVDIFGGNGYNEFHEAKRHGAVMAEASLDEVRQNLRLTGYPEDRIATVRGPAEQTLNGAFWIDRIALLRLDMDWYVPTVVALERLEPRLMSGGIFIADDYGHYLGQRKAIDEYFADKPIMLHRIDYSCRAGVKR